MRQTNIRLRRVVPGTRMPWLVALALVVLGLPRTILSDLGAVEPEGSAVYYLLALVPFAAWFAVAILLPTVSPIRDHLATGILYGLSLVVVHEVLWNADASVRHHLPHSAIESAARVGPPLDQVVLHGYAFLIAIMIGIGTGLVAGMLGFGAKMVRSRLAARAAR